MSAGGTEQHPGRAGAAPTSHAAALAAVDSPCSIYHDRRQWRRPAHARVDRLQPPLLDVVSQLLCAWVTRWKGTISTGPTCTDWVVASMFSTEAVQTVAVACSSGGGSGASERQRGGGHCASERRRGGGGGGAAYRAGAAINGSDVVVAQCLGLLQPALGALADSGLAPGRAVFAPVAEPEAKHREGEWEASEGCDGAGRNADCVSVLHSNSTAATACPLPRHAAHHASSSPELK